MLYYLSSAMLHVLRRLSEYFHCLFFNNQEGYSTKDFFQECKSILDDDDVFGTERFFIEFLLASSEYDSFIMLMTAEMKTIDKERQKK